MNQPENDNPYTPPLSESSPGDKDLGSDTPSLNRIAREVFLQWEKLRLLYIAFLGLLTIALGGVQIAKPPLLGLVVIGAVAANLCYFAGPIIETYVRWLGYRGRWLRWVLFISGMLFAGVLAIGVLATELLPNQ